MKSFGFGKPTFKPKYKFVKLGVNVFKLHAQNQRVISDKNARILKI